MKLLRLEKTTDKGYFNCVGDTLKGRRCGCQIARHNVVAGEQLLRQLPRRSVNPDLLEQDLRAIAYKLLCVRWHRDAQVDRMVNRWRPVVLAANAKSKAQFFQSHTRQPKPSPKPKPEPVFTECEFKQEDNADETKATEEPSTSTTENEDEKGPRRDRPQRTASEQEEFLRREKERCEEARRQSQRERAEQKEAKAQAEREGARRQREEEEAKRRHEQTSPRPQPRPTSNEDWSTSWSTYRHRWTLVAELPKDATLADLDKIFPWPVRNIHQLGLCISKFDESFEKDVESFFRQVISQRRAGAVGDDKRVILKTLREETLCWHPDKVLVQFPVSAVPKALRELATKVTQVLTRLMGIFRN